MCAMVLFVRATRCVLQQYAAIGALDDKLSKAFGFVNTVLPVYIGLLIAERNILDHQPVWV